jgi:hypothetical protein
MRYERVGEPVDSGVLDVQSHDAATQRATATITIATLRRPTPTNRTSYGAAATSAPKE